MFVVVVCDEAFYFLLVDTVDLTVSESETHSLYERTMDVSKRNSLLKKMAEYQRRKDIADHSGYEAVSGGGHSTKLFDLFSSGSAAVEDTGGDFLRSPTLLDLEKVFIIFNLNNIIRNIY